MNKFHPYFGQVITDTELSEILNELTGGFERFIQDFGYRGVAAGAVVTRHEPANFSVDVSGPAILYDNAANRISWGSTQVVNLAVDEIGSPTAVVGIGNEKWLSIFARFVATPSDPRTSELNETVYYRDVAGFQLRVAQGAQGAVGTASRVALRATDILLADVRIVTGQSSIQATDISDTRTQAVFAMAGSPLSLRARSLQDVLQAMVTAINGYPSRPEVALLAQANAFTLGQSVNVPQADVALLSTTKRPADAPGMPSNTWKLVIDAPMTGARLARIYAGGDPAAGGLILTLNARWNVATARWNYDDGTFSATAVLLQDGYLRPSAQPANSTPWAIWPTERGEIRLGGDVRSAGEFLYSSPRGRTTVLSLLDQVDDGGGGGGGSWNIGDHEFAFGTGGRFLLPVRLPVGAQIISFDMNHFQGAADATSYLELHKFPYAGAGAIVGARANSNSTTGWKQTSLILSSYTVKNDQEFLFLRVWIGRTSGEPSLVAGIRVHWLTSGPS